MLSKEWPFPLKHLTIIDISILSDNLLPVLLPLCPVWPQDAARRLSHVTQRGSGGVWGGERGAQEARGERRERRHRERRTSGRANSARFCREDIHTVVYDDDVGRVGWQVAACNCHFRLVLNVETFLETEVSLYMISSFTQLHPPYLTSFVCHTCCVASNLKAMFYFTLQKCIHPMAMERLKHASKCFHLDLNRWNEHFVDSILGQYHLLRRKFNLNHPTISSPPKKVVQSPRAFIFFTFHRMNPMYAHGYSHIHKCI